MSELAPDADLSADLCVIGSGAAGISIAREFLGTPHTVLVLEGGGGRFEPGSQEPYRSEVVGLPHSGIHGGRARVLGGTTTLWAGQALPLFGMDFEARDWVPYSGWPLRRAELEPYYRRAEAVMQIPRATYDAQTWPRPDAAPPAYAAARLTAFYSQFAAEPNFAVKYRAELQAAPNVRVLTHANAVSLEAAPDADALREVRVRSFDGREARARARVFVICCGGIETARLLLCSDSVEPNGIGNRRDVVGRFFQDHPGVHLPVRPHSPARFGRAYDSFRRDGIRYVPKMAAGEALQRAERILNACAEVYYPVEEDDPLLAAKKVLKAARDPALRAGVPQALASVARRPGKVARAAFRHYLLRQPASVGSSQPHLGFGVEQAPNPDSRVTLSRERDSLGLRRAVLDWRLTEAETRSVGVFARALADEWRRLGVADVDPDALCLEGRERGEHGGFIDANHHIGTARMGTDPATSAVDPRCRVHGYANLYVGSSAVFPTGGFSNPTLTVLALCLRLADDIKASLPRAEMVAAG